MCPSLGLHLHSGDYTYTLKLLSNSSTKSRRTLTLLIAFELRKKSVIGARPRVSRLAFSSNRAQMVKALEPRIYSEKVFVSQVRVSGFPGKGSDLWGGPESFREVWETSGEFPLEKSS